MPWVRQTWLPSWLHWPGACVFTQSEKVLEVLRGCLKSLHGFLQRYPHAMVIVDFRELRTIVTSSEAALHQLKTLMSGLFKQPLRKGGITYGQCPVQRPAVPPHGVPGFHQPDARRVSAPRPAL